MDSVSPILGTVQLGMAYGVANTTGKPDEQAALDIVRTAWEGGVRELDTAMDYGDSERRLGRIIHELGLGSEVRINGKPDSAWDGTDFAKLDRDLDSSLQRLGIGTLHTLILHREHLLGQWDAMAPHLARLVRDGRVRRIGVSVYSPDAAGLAAGLEGLDVIQIPSNLLDRRFERAGIDSLARAGGKRLQIRSIFLQGLVFMKAGSLPGHMRFAEEEIRRLESVLAELGLSPLEAAVGYARQAWPGSNVLFGAESPQQVRLNLAAFHSEVPGALARTIRAAFPDVPERILNPSLWN